jgi:hypothetical protein
MYIKDKSWGDEPTKKSRLMKLFDVLGKLPPAKTGLEAYGQISNSLNLLEDQVFGYQEWKTPRTFEDRIVRSRMYASHPEWFKIVEGFSGVTNLVHGNEYIFISRMGAIEIQLDTKEDKIDKPFHTRTSAVVFKKNDAYGDDVWNSKNSDIANESTSEAQLIKFISNYIEIEGWTPLADLPNKAKEIMRENIEQVTRIPEDRGFFQKQRTKLCNIFKQESPLNLDSVFEFCIQKARSDNFLWPAYITMCAAISDVDPLYQQKLTMHSRQTSPINSNRFSFAEVKNRGNLL